MTQVDIARVALGAPALQQVFVVSRPECLLIKSWARSERNNTEDAAALIGNLFRDCDDALGAVGGGSEPRTLMVESNDRVLVVSRVAEDMAAAFVFEQSAPLGLIRVQARQLTAQLARTLAGHPGRPANVATRPAPRRPGPGERAAPTGGPAMSERSPAFGVPAAHPQPRPPVADRRGAVGVDASAPSARSPAFGVPPTVSPRSPMNERAPVPSPRAAMSERSPAFGIPAVNPPPVRRADRSPGDDRRTPFAGDDRRTPYPGDDRRTPYPPGDDRRTPFPAGDRPAPETTSGRFDQVAVRVAAFAQGSTDSRSALLRLSLRTGLPMELLERTGSLTPAQAELVNRALDELQQKNPGG